MSKECLALLLHYFQTRQSKIVSRAVARHAATSADQLWWAALLKIPCVMYIVLIEACPMAYTLSVILLQNSGTRYLTHLEPLLRPMHLN